MAQFYRVTHFLSTKFVALGYYACYDYGLIHSASRCPTFSRKLSQVIIYYGYDVAENTYFRAKKFSTQGQI